MFLICRIVFTTILIFVSFLTSPGHELSLAVSFETGFLLLPDFFSIPDQMIAHSNLHSDGRCLQFNFSSFDGFLCFITSSQRTQINFNSYRTPWTFNFFVLHRLEFKFRLPGFPVWADRLAFFQTHDNYIEGV